MRTQLFLLFSVVCLAAAPGYKVTGRIQVGGDGGWDYVGIDPATGRLYASHTSRVEVVDLATGKVVGMIPDTPGIHGIEIAPDLGKGFTSNGREGKVGVFDPKTLMVSAKIDAGKNPDAIRYEPVSHRVFAFNGSSHDATVIDAKTNQVVATIPVGGKPEFAQADGKGHLFVNIEDKSEILEIDATKAEITQHFPIAPCEEPSGLAIDTAKHHLFAVCRNKMMVVVDAGSGKVLATPAIGAGADGVAFDSGYAFSSNGNDGTITVVGETKPGTFEAVETVTTEFGARTIGVNPKTHKIYVPTADYGAPGESQNGRPGRRPMLPDSFHLVVVSK